MFDRRMKILKLFLVVAFIMYASLSFSITPPAELTQAELAKLTNKELIIHSKEIPKRPWPEITIFALIDVLPVEATALFSHYEDQKTYIPDLTKSYLVKKISENEMIVDFEMRTPWPLSNSKYSTGNVFKRLEGNGYEISWYLVKSDSLIDSKGMVQFIPYEKKTLMKYRSLIYPDSKFASIFSSKAESGMSKTVQAIVTYIEESKKKNPEKIQKLINLLPK
ncbi:MAG: hypothetical protein C0392_06405 [Syntrophus sp. (in: bacteria)]|nr:hypothetical protein [Syntrophus sp. (in: bacteria)]